jgi:predicted lipoprotein with Yx(FWY)xxD motif
MSIPVLARIPLPLKAGVPVAAALLVAACGSSGSPQSAATGAATGGSTGSASTTAATVITTHSGSGGTFLTDGSGRAVYLWAKDPMGKSECAGACATAWPPVTDAGKLTAAGGVNAADLGTITRSDGTKQVTYDGHALYYYVGDSSAGQTSGQGSDGFGAKWWLVAPSGTQITAADTATTASTPSSHASTSTSTSGGW